MKQLAELMRFVAIFWILSAPLAAQIASGESVSPETQTRVFYWDISTEALPELLTDAAECLVRWSLSLLPLAIVLLFPLRRWRLSLGFRISLTVIAALLSAGMILYHLLRAVAFITLFGRPWAVSEIVSCFGPLSVIIIGVCRFWIVRRRSNIAPFPTSSNFHTTDIPPIP